MSNINWPDIIRRVVKRERAVRIVQKNLEGEFFSAREISSTDIFVEKAEIELSNRSKNMFRCAVASLVSLATIIGLSLYFISENFESLKIAAPPNGELTTQILVAGIIRNASLLGFVLGSLYLSASLFRAFLHEATILKNRVHSVRLGRLYVYLKFGSIDCQRSLDDVREKISAAEIERIFGWNIETSTAFKDIDPSYLTKSIWSNIPDTLAAVVGKKDK